MEVHHVLTQGDIPASILQVHVLIVSLLAARTRVLSRGSWPGHPASLPRLRPKSVFDSPSVTAEIPCILPRCAQLHAGSRGAGSVLGCPACGRVTYPQPGLCYQCAGLS